MNFQTTKDIINPLLKDVLSIFGKAEHRKKDSQTIHEVLSTLSYGLTELNDYNASVKLNHDDTNKEYSITFTLTEEHIHKQTKLQREMEKLKQLEEEQERIISEYNTQKQVIENLNEPTRKRN